MRTVALILVAASAHAAVAVAAVRTESGMVSGSGTEVRAYKGIPYAAAPVGTLRWQPPAPPPGWRGVRAFKEFGPACPQSVSLTLGAGSLPKQDEDCLTLNIWTPAQRRAQKLPVLVSTHGGGFVAGGASLAVYDGEGFARQGIVFVSLNYRLGVLGFLSHPQLVRESPHHASGNYGLMDQIAALRWIQRNIAAFGGDPKRVTIFGESAGATSVCYLLVSPLSEGLFQRAIAQSAQGIYLPMPAPAGGNLGGDIAELRALPVAELLKRTTQCGAAAAGTQFQPIVDGWVLPQDPAVLFETGKAHRARLIAGTNADDAIALMMITGASVRTLPAYREYLRTHFGDSADRAFELYPATTDQESRRVLRQLVNDLNFRFGTHAVLLAMARANHAYWYQFTRFDPVSRKLGAHAAIHGAEMGYVFGDLRKSLFTINPEGFDDTDRAIAKAMNGAWVQFAKTGDPNAPGLPPWPAVSPGSLQYLEYGDQIAVREASREAQMQFLAQYLEQKRHQ